MKPPMENNVRLVIDKSSKEQHISDIYNHLVSIIDRLSSVDPALSRWYVPALTKTISKTYIPLIEKDNIIHELLHQANKYDKGYNGYGPSLIYALSQEVRENKGEDNKFLAKIKFSYGSSLVNGSFVLEARELRDLGNDGKWEKFAEIMSALSFKEQFFWINTSPKSYLKHRIFPHRQWVGWMAIVPDVDLTGEMPFLAHCEYIPNLGSLIVTTKEPFDPNNEDHVTQAQATEVFLADKGLLPLRGQ